MSVDAPKKTRQADALSASVSWPLVARFVRSSLAAVAIVAMGGDGVQAVGSGCSG